VQLPPFRGEMVLVNVSSLEVLDLHKDDMDTSETTSLSVAWKSRVQL
jgi:hypothetical protein